MKKDYIVPALERGLHILELFGQDSKKLSVKEITTALKSTTSQIYRTLYTLEKMHYLEKCDDKKYRLGSQVMHRAFCYLASSEITEVAAAPMRRLRDSTSATTHLAVRSGIEAIYHFRVQSRQQLVPNFAIGTRLPAHRCAVGRMLLSGLSEEKITALYRHVTLDDAPAGSPRSLPALIEQLKQDKARKYASNASHDSKAIAAPIVDYRGKVIAAINISSIHLDIEEGRIQPDLLQALLCCANHISEQFGGYDYFDTLLKPTHEN